MQIIFMCLLVGGLVWFVPSHYLKVYSYIGATLIVSLYFFGDFPSDYDIYRHYQTFNIMESYSLKELFASQNYTIQVGSTSYPLFLLYLWVISRFHVRELLPVITGSIIYFCNINMALDYRERFKISVNSYRLCFFLMIMLTNFIAISGIRNLLAATIFGYGVYSEFVKHKKYSGWLLYVVAIFIHSSCFIYAGIRIALFFYKKYSKKYIDLFILIFLSIMPIIYRWIITIKTNIPLFFDNLLSIYYKYSENYVGNSNIFGVRLISISLYISTILSLLFVKKYSKEKRVNERFYDFYVLALLFAIGSYIQYDIFVRSAFIIIPFFAIIMMQLYDEFNESNWKRISGGSNIQVTAYLLVYTLNIGSCIMTIYYRFFHQYIINTGYFKL